MKNEQQRKPQNQPGRDANRPNQPNIPDREINRPGQGREDKEQNPQRNK